MPPKRGKKSHTKGGPKYVANADEIEHRNKALAEPEQRRGFFDDDGDDMPEFDPKIDDDKPKAPVFKTANLNAGGDRNIKIKDLGNLAAAEDAGPRLSRKERDEKEAEEKKAAYQKLHKEGKTEEYAKDMERLNAAKERREQNAAKKKEIEEANAAAEAAMRAASLAAQAEGEESDSDDDAPAKVDPREVKKMNPKQLKDALKARGLSTQGAKKELMTRLLEG